MLRNAFIGLFLFLTASGALADMAATFPVEAFFSFPKISDVKISPDGKYLALVIADPKTGEDRKALALVTTEAGHKVVGSFSTKGPELIANFWWANDERILVSTATQTGSFDPPVLNGELYAINVDGSRQEMLMPTGNGANSMLAGGVSHDSDQVFFYGLLHRSNDDPKHVLVYGATRGLNHDYDQVEQAYYLDIYSGGIRKVLISPVLNGYILADNAGDVRVAVGDDAKTGAQQVFYRPSKDTLDWKNLSELFKDDDPAENEVAPIRMGPDDKSIYWLGRTATSTLGLYLADPDTGKSQTLFADPDLDIDDLVWSFDWNTPAKVVAVDTMPGLPAVHLVDEDDPKAQYLANLYQAFPGQKVSITSNSRDDSLMVVSVASDKNPGEFYLFNGKTGQATFMFSSKPEIDPKAMATMQPVMIQARDGLQLHGYLTLPPGSSGKGLPLIINPHGGPHGIRDEWGWDPEVQFFASRGYAVLQVNYRGSGGYGMKFQDMGYRNWGTTMQDDLADAVGWAVKQGVADPNRVCIYGGSYGGYAALENAVRYPDLYKCAVGYAGVYDLTLFAHHGDTHHYASGARYLDVVHGDDDARLKEYSPAFHADQIKAALFIVYSGEDMRVVPKNAEELMAALDKLGKKYDVMYEPNEMHGYYKPEHRYELYTRMLAFFDKYIGPGVTTPVAAPVAATKH